MCTYKHIIWDWNGTLFDDISLCIETMNLLLQKHNLEPMSKEKYTSIFNFPVSEYYKKLGFDFSKEPFENISDEYIKLYYQTCFSCKLHQNAKKVLVDISASGITQSILSAAHQDYLNKCVEYYGIEKYFIKLIGLDNIHAAGKVENGVKWISSISYEKSQIVLIGDTTHDYEVATAMGCSCILVACGHQSIGRLMLCGVPVVEKLNDLIQLLAL